MKLSTQQGLNLEFKMDKNQETKKPTLTSAPKPTMKVEVIGDNVVITIPKKDLTKQLLAGLI